MKKKKLFFLIVLLCFCSGFILQSAFSQEQKHPIIGEITWQEIHKTYEEIPHKYDLFVDIIDPTNGGSLIYDWSINCGYWFGSTNSDRVRWHYDIPGECVDAIVTLTVINSADAKTLRKQYVFAGPEPIEYIEYPLPEQEEPIAEEPVSEELQNEPKDEVIGPVRDDWQPGPEKLQQPKGTDEIPREVLEEIGAVPRQPEIGAMPEYLQPKPEDKRSFWERFKHGWENSSPWLKAAFVVGVILSLVFLIILAVKLGLVAFIVFLLKTMGAAIISLIVKFWPMILKWFSTGKTWIGKTFDTAGQILKKIFKKK